MAQMEPLGRNHRENPRVLARLALQSVSRRTGRSHTTIPSGLAIRRTRTTPTKTMCKLLFAMLFYTHTKYILAVIPVWMIKARKKEKRQNKNKKKDTNVGPMCYPMHTHIHTRACARAHTNTHTRARTRTGHACPCFPPLCLISPPARHPAGKTIQLSIDWRWIAR